MSITRGTLVIVNICAYVRTYIPCLQGNLLIRRSETNNYVQSDSTPGNDVTI